MTAIRFPSWEKKRKRKRKGEEGSKEQGKERVLKNAPRSSITIGKSHSIQFISLEGRRKKEEIANLKNAPPRKREEKEKMKEP